MTWGRIDDKLHSSPKWRSATKGARSLWTTALSWSMDQLTDGAIPRYMLPVLDGTKAEAASLVACGLWRATDEGWQFHDWEDYQPSRAQVLAERDAAKERQKRARDKSRESRRESRRDGPVTHGDVTPAVTVPPTHTQLEPDGSNVSRADVEALCDHLADRVEANGSPRPTTTKAWRDAARLMLDRDGRTLDQVHRAIDWSQDHEFWRSNVLSMPKLREKYDQLRLQAARADIRPVDRQAELLRSEMEKALASEGALLIGGGE